MTSGDRLCYCPEDYWSPQQTAAEHRPSVLHGIWLLKLWNSPDFSKCRSIFRCLAHCACWPIALRKFIVGNLFGISLTIHPLPFLIKFVYFLPNRIKVLSIKRFPLCYIWRHNKLMRCLVVSLAGRHPEIRDVCSPVQTKDPRRQCRIYGWRVQEIAPAGQQWWANLSHFFSQVWLCFRVLIIARGYPVVVANHGASTGEHDPSVGGDGATVV